VVVVGAGYIAVELAGIFGALGAKTSQLIRYDQVKVLEVQINNDACIKYINELH
jgi:pyruvate/2-oxoglutarate dehydrogenase complex dihydrolipoamide dehydrogenase (E3) component